MKQQLLEQEYLAELVREPVLLFPILLPKFVVFASLTRDPILLLKPMVFISKTLLPSVTDLGS